jgi:hypothetical protein
MRENRPYGSEGGEGNLPDPYPRAPQRSARWRESWIRHRQQGTSLRPHPTENQNANVVSVPQCRMLGPGPDKDLTQNLDCGRYCNKVLITSAAGPYSRQCNYTGVAYEKGFDRCH